MASEGRRKLEAFRGRLDLGAPTIRKALETLFDQERAIEKLVTYARLRHDGDLGDDRHKRYHGQATALLHRFEEQSAWLEPELLALPSEVLEGYETAAELQPYRFFLQRVASRKPHTLTTREEELISMASEAFTAVSSAFGVLESADLSFGSVRDSEGNEYEVTHGSYSRLQRNQDRQLRQRAFQALHGQFDRFANTCCELLNGGLAIVASRC